MSCSPGEVRYYSPVSRDLGTHAPVCVAQDFVGLCLCLQGTGNALTGSLIGEQFLPQQLASMHLPLDLSMESHSGHLSFSESPVLFFEILSP